MAAKKGNKYALGNEGGRPTKYDKKYCKAIIAYFSTPPNRKEMVSKSEGYNRSGGKNFEKKEFRTVPNTLPTFNRFALSIGVNVDTVREWAKVHKEFSEAFAIAKELYKDFLNENGLMNLYSSQYAKFVAINTTDMKDKQDVGLKFSFSKEDAKDYA